MTSTAREANGRELCERLSVAFANHIDRRDYPAVLDLFAEDAVLDRIGTVIRGKSALAAWLKSRPDDVVTRHICSNFDIVQTGPTAAEGRTYFTFYKAAATADVGEIDGPAAVGEYHDSFILTAQGWKILKRKIIVIFQRRTA
ncbi:MAG TPA: nuclear transport factor 2 family protein [Xanthobacteraceae bacterium]|nr:nuclear transport factor 2 family protein [Xanthobacteraceae bacterium]